MEEGMRHAAFACRSSLRCSVTAQSMSGNLNSNTHSVQTNPYSNNCSKISMSIAHCIQPPRGLTPDTSSSSWVVGVERTLRWNKSFIPEWFVPSQSPLHSHHSDLQLMQILPFLYSVTVPACSLFTFSSHPPTNTLGHIQSLYLRPPRKRPLFKGNLGMALKSNLSSSVALPASSDNLLARLDLWRMQTETIREVRRVQLSSMRERVCPTASPATTLTLTQCKFAKQI